jgi:hypothetical protein
VASADRRREGTAARGAACRIPDLAAGVPEALRIRVLQGSRKDSCEIRAGLLRADNGAA